MELVKLINDLISTTACGIEIKCPKQAEKHAEELLADFLKECKDMHPEEVLAKVERVCCNSNFITRHLHDVVGANSISSNKSIDLDDVRHFAAINGMDQWPFECVINEYLTTKEVAESYED